MLEQQLGVPIACLAGQVAELVQLRRERRRVAGSDRPEDLALLAQVVAWQPADHPEVEEGHLAVLAEQVVARMGIAERQLERGRGRVVVAVDDLGVAVAHGVRLGGNRVEAEPVDPIGDEDPTAAELGVDRGNADERVPAPKPRQAAMVGRLELVVALLDDPPAELVDHSLDVEPRHHPAQQRRQHPDVAHVRFDRVGDPGVLHLDRDLTAVARLPPVHLTDARRRRRLRVDRSEDAFGLRSPLAAQEPAHLVPVDRRDVVAQRGQAPLQIRGLVGVEARELDRRQHLTDLHRRAAHRGELVDERVDCRDHPVAAAALALVVGAARVEPVARPSRGAAGRDPAEPRGAGRSTGDRTLSRLSPPLGHRYECGGRCARG